MMTDNSTLGNAVKAIFFDVNGTLRTRELHGPTQSAAYQRLHDILGKNAASDRYWRELEQGYRSYSLWAQTNLLQLSESEIWTCWILPDEPHEKVIAHADELMLAWIERKGQAVPKPGVEDVLNELIARGYQLGLISNSISTLDIPHFLDRFGWNKFFKTVILSSFEGSRKPAPNLFITAAQKCQLGPSECAYVGNRFLKDIVGCKSAGYSLGIIIESLDNQFSVLQEQTVFPDLKINSLNDLLNIFHAR